VLSVKVRFVGDYRIIILFIGVVKVVNRFCCLIDIFWRKRISCFDFYEEAILSSGYIVLPFNWTFPVEYFFLEIRNTF
jgi:hypothetical protein